MSEDLRFDLDARVEVWVSADEIREHALYGAALEIEESGARMIALRAIAVSIANARIADHSDAQIDITAVAAPSDINLDRIPWGEMKPAQARE